MASGFTSSVETDVPTIIYGLLDRLDGERERSRRDADCDPVALLLAHERAAHGRVDGDAACRRIAFDRTYQGVGLGVAIRVDDVDRRAGPGNARMRLLDDLGPSDHLLELVDPAVQETDRFLGLR